MSDTHIHAVRKLHIGAQFIMSDQGIVSQTRLQLHRRALWSRCHFKTRQCTEGTQRALDLKQATTLPSLSWETVHACSLCFVIRVAFIVLLIVKRGLMQKKLKIVNFLLHILQKQFPFRCITLHHVNVRFYKGILRLSKSIRIAFITDTFLIAWFPKESRLLSL